MALPMGVRANANRIGLSVCLNINNYFEGLSPDTPDYDHFYESLQKLRTVLNSRATSLTVSVGSTTSDLKPLQRIQGSDPPFRYSPGQIVRELSVSDYESLRVDLWDLIFPSRKKISDDSRVRVPQVGRDLVQMTSQENLPHLTRFVSIIAGERLPQTPREGSGVFTILQNIREFAHSSEKQAAVEKFKFIQRHDASKAERDNLIQGANRARSTETGPDPLVMKLVENLATTAGRALLNYLDPGYAIIDIDEVVHSFSALSNEPVLMRLMGLLRDCEIDLPAEFVPTANHDTFFFVKVEIASNTDTISIPTKIKGICSSDGKKYAYLVSEDAKPPQNQFFQNTILKVRTEQPTSGAPWLSHLYTFDKIAQDLKIKAIDDALINDSRAVGDDPHDSFTRGIIFGNTGLAELVKPVSYPFAPADSTVLPDTFAFTEHFVCHGHRVAAVINGDYHSLTNRRIELSQPNVDDKATFYVFDKNEGPIHFDAVSSFIQDGEHKSAVSDSLFEYPGELLSLKSAFSRSKTVTRAEAMVEATQTHDDGGLFKSAGRIERAIEFTRFPEEPKSSKCCLACHYDIPEYIPKGQGPRLRFNKESQPREYSFVVSEEYLNGWGVPLESSDAFPYQLSIKDLTKTKALFLPPAIRFCPLESKKPVLLFHTRNPEAHDQSHRAEQQASSLKKKSAPNEALETLIVRNDDSETQPCSRHVLPARIAFEHAFWYDLLSEMSVDKSFEWKTRYNCPFVSEQEFRNFTKGDQKRPCPENHCGSYCGGTAMLTFYEDDHITPNHLSDPSIVGVSLYCFRDRSFLSPISTTPIILQFGGTPGLNPTSCRLSVSETNKELEISVTHSREDVTISLKPGMRIWVQLENVISKEYENEHLSCSWYQSLAPVYSAKLLTAPLDKKKKNPRRSISIVHAVRKPVVTPEIKALCSKPSTADRYSHIQEWIEREYPGLTIDSNVIAVREKLHDAGTEIGSSLITVGLQARFERLDAFLKDGRVQFVDTELPTGGLELWMRKEEYIDDPDQLVFPSDSLSGGLGSHLPSQPVVVFDSDQNVAHRDFRMEFTPEIIHQLKNRPITVPNHSKDIFRELTSTVDFQLDAKSTKFEERRYKLRNTSIFKSLFTSAEDENDDDFSEQSTEFRVLLLNNSRPDHPTVSHAVTTIRELGTKHKHFTTAQQKGNIVTIYLKRPRLTSGKNERIGVVVHHEKSRYYKAFAEGDMFSKAGRDIVTDAKPTASPFLRYDPDDRAKQDIVLQDTNIYDGRFHEDLGIVSYLPLFDPDKGLWKFEVELDVKTAEGLQLHNPFVVFSLVHFQPYSINYNDKWSHNNSALADLPQDLRLSAHEPFIWCYLLPERKLSVSFHKPGIWDLGSWTDFLNRWGSVDLTISFDSESLHHFQGSGRPLLRSNFIFSVEGSNDRLSWYPVMSVVEGRSNEWKLMHPLLAGTDLDPGNNEARLQVKYQRASNPSDSGNNTVASQKFDDFRVGLVEVEWFVEKDWSQMDFDQYLDVTENQDLRIRYVELIY